MPDFAVAGVRYSRDVPRLAEFFARLGLSRRAATRDDGYVEFVAGDSVLLVHPAGPDPRRDGTAELSFEVSDLGETLTRLGALGLDAIVWDESYGRHAAIRDPRGDGIWITERMRDHYGYLEFDAAPNDLRLVAVRYSHDFPAEIGFYDRLGFAARAGATEDWTPLEATGLTAGVIGLHACAGDLPRGAAVADNPAAPAPAVNVSFETHEPLDALVARLSALGLTAVRDGTGAPHVTITDPDGVAIEIHSWP